MEHGSNLIERIYTDNLILSANKSVFIRSIRVIRVLLLSFVFFH